jgi:hypothetical protein
MIRKRKEEQGKKEEKTEGRGTKENKNGNRIPTLW